MTMDVFKPDVSYRLEDKLIGQVYVKVYSCKSCGRELALGQVQCACGMPVMWEGINAYESRKKRRNRK